MRILVNVFALIGLLATVGAAALYVQGWRAAQDMDPRASQVFGDFLQRTLQQDVASASVIKLPLEEEVSREDAIESMKLRANARNIKLVGRLPYHEEMRARTGEEYPYLEIFQFCDAGTAAALLDYNRDFVAYMPCTIALYEDAAGQGWLVTMNLDLLIHGGREMEPGLKEQVLRVEEGLLDIMAAGATGAL
jgi:uncharacterized protein (DUF302 family)